MAGSNSHITILTLNVNGLNAPIKRHRLENWIKIQNPSVCCIQETHLTCKDTHRLKTKGRREIYQANGVQKQNKTKNNSCNPSVWWNRLLNNKDQKRQKRALHNGKRINATRRANDPKYVYSPNTGASRFIKQGLSDLQRDLDSHTIMVGDFNTPLSILDRSMRQKINNDIQDLSSDLAKQT